MSLKYNFGQIEGAASAVQGSVGTIQGLLDEGGQAVQKLSSIWGGSGSEAYLGVQQRWDSTAAELNAALKDLSNKVGQAGAGMQDTEKGVTGMFA
jgi:early secretory antigenic target protein ESAT-6